MPPKRALALEDSRSESSSTKERPGHPVVTALNGKGRRTGNTVNTPTSVKDTINASPATSAAAVASVSGSGPDGLAGVSMPSQPRIRRLIMLRYNGRLLITRYYTHIGMHIDSTLRRPFKTHTIN